MKNLFFIFFVLIGLNCQSQNQDWRPVRNDGMYIYNANDNYRTIRIDSTHQDADTLHLIGFNEWNVSGEFMECYTPFGAPWFGKEIINYPDSTVIKNRRNQSMVFPIKPMESWVFYASEIDTFRAYLKESKSTEILGVMDSVRIIELDSEINYLPTTLIISKNYGLVQGLNFSLYPFHSYIFFDEYFESATLAGIEKTGSGIQNLSTWDVYDFEPGDALHISDYLWCLEEEASYYKQIISILEKEENKDTIMYTFERCSNLGIDTFKWVIPKVSILDSLPYQPIRISDVHSAFALRNSSLGLTVDFPGGFFYSDVSDSCYQFVHADKKKNNRYNPIYPNGYYIKGLGGPYHIFSGAACESSSQLVYYKIGGTEWGTPFDCDELLDISEQKYASPITVYPNPANNQLTIESLDFKPEMELIIRTISGKIMLQTILTGKKHEQNISNLANGIYLYQLVWHKIPVMQGKLVKIEH